jgi:DNA-3-methyladenine glycosylase
VKKLARSFYRRPAIELAPHLVGKILVHRVGRREYRARIVETEAYVGEHDLACHASKGRTARTEVMFGRAGHAYVYFIYGMYDMLNVVASDVDDAQAVLIRAAEPLDGWKADLSGPGKLARAMKITGADNGVDLTGRKLFFIDDGAPRPKISRSKRVGVDYAGRWTHALLRFFDVESRAVSNQPNKITAKTRRIYDLNSSRLRDLRGDSSSLCGQFLGRKKGGQEKRGHHSFKKSDVPFFSRPFFSRFESAQRITAKPRRCEEFTI